LENANQILYFSFAIKKYNNELLKIGKKNAFHLWRFSVFWWWLFCNYLWEI